MCFFSDRAPHCPRDTPPPPAASAQKPRWWCLPSHELAWYHAPPRAIPHRRRRGAPPQLLRAGPHWRHLPLLGVYSVSQLCSLDPSLMDNINTRKGCIVSRGERGKRIGVKGNQLTYWLGRWADSSSSLLTTWCLIPGTWHPAIYRYRLVPRYGLILGISWGWCGWHTCRQTQISNEELVRNTMPQPWDLQETPRDALSPTPAGERPPPPVVGTQASSPSSCFFSDSEEDGGENRSQKWIWLWEVGWVVYLSCGRRDTVLQFFCLNN